MTFRLLAECSNQLSYRSADIDIPVCPHNPIVIISYHLRTKQRHDSFITEAELLQKLKHRHVVELKGIVADATTMALVLERIEFPKQYHYFETLFHFLWDVRHTNHAITHGARVAWMKQLCQAVAYLHSQRILHLDIKTSNMMLDSGCRIAPRNVASEKLSLSLSLSLSYSRERESQRERERELQKEL